MKVYSHSLKWWEVDEFISSMIDETTSFVCSQGDTSSSSSSSETHYSGPTSTGYSGPTLFDIQNALSSTVGCNLPKQLPPSRIASRFEKRISKRECKYTLKMKTDDIGMSDDGYKWRKYGQKHIKNTPNPRSYYKCTKPRCNAKKQVERSLEDPETLIITYEGLHLHFAYPISFHNQPDQQISPPPLKKAKSASGKPEQCPSVNTAIQERNREGRVVDTPQGLLEDLVPIMVRNPSLFENDVVCMF